MREGWFGMFGGACLVSFGEGEVCSEGVLEGKVSVFRVEVLSFGLVLWAWL